MQDPSTAYLLNRLVAAEINRLPDPMLPDGLPSAQWDALFSEARRQTVTATALNAIERHPSLAATMPLPLAAQWMAEAERIRRRHAASDEAEASLLASLAVDGIRPTVMKGSTVARMYPDPSSRQCGDIDLYIADADRAAVDRYLASRDITATPHSDGSRSFRHHGFEVELHYRFFDLHSPRNRRQLRRLFDADPTLTTGSPESTLLMLSAHILKHAIGRGIGLRQLADLAVATRHLKNSVDPLLMQRMIRAAGLVRWTATVYSFLHTRLALPEDCLPCPDIRISETKGARLQEIISRGGNFGLHTEGHTAPSPLSTAAAFGRAAGFSLRTAPAEALAAVTTLANGRLSNMFNRRHTDR